MWSHYADQHKGICIRFRAKSTSPFCGAALRVKYSNQYPQINSILDSDQEKFQKLALWKAEHWGYEKEWRIISTDGAGVKLFPADQIHTVMLGAKISFEHEQLVRGWVSQIKRQFKSKRLVFRQEVTR